MKDNVYYLKHKNSGEEYYKTPHYTKLHSVYGWLTLSNDNNEVHFIYESDGILNCDNVTLQYDILLIQK